MSINKNILLLLVAFCALVGCDKINNESLPNYPVRIDLGDYGKWNTYGVHSLGEFRFFYTGFGGVLLFMGQDMYGNPSPLAFDMSCPVEHNADVTVTIDSDNLDAYCAKCKSRYDVITGLGGPKSGMAIDRKVGLNIYKVRSTINGGYIISNY